MYEKFDKRFKTFYDELSVSLHEYRNGEMKNEEANQDFVKEIKSIISNCSANLEKQIELPRESQFFRESVVEKTERGVWDNLIHHIRPMILKQFHQISDKQQQTITNHKIKISELLQSSKLFGNLSVVHHSNEKDQILHTINALAGEFMPRECGINTGFNFICNFRFSYEGYVQNVIYSTVVQFFGTEIRKIETMAPIVREIIEKTNEIIKIIEDSKDESFKSLDKIKNNADLMISGVKILGDIGLLPSAVGSLLGNIATFGESIIKIKPINNSNDSNTNARQRTQNSKLLTQELKQKTKEMRESIQIHEKDIEPYMSESIKSLPDRIRIALQSCEERLIREIGNWPEKVSISMVEEFIDHIRYTRESENEWRRFTQLIGKEIWTDYAIEENISSQISESL